MVIRRLFRTDGSHRDLYERKSVAALRELLRAESTEAVLLHNKHVMLIDEMAYRKHLPMNVRATEFYLSFCRYGLRHKIRGDAVVVPAHEIYEAHQ